MSDQYLGEIRIFTGNYAPEGWLFCNGQMISVSQYQALFSVIGTTYGGDGQSTFGLPDLRGRLGVHMGTGTTGTAYPLAAKNGVESVTLAPSELPAHTHTVNALSVAGTSASPANAFWAAGGTSQYSTVSASGSMSDGAVSSVGGNNEHSNIMPCFALSFIIALQGNYPTPPN